jgi:transcriptional regulator CtsR
VLVALFALASTYEVESDKKVWQAIKEKAKKIDWSKVDRWVDKGYAIYKVIKGITDDAEVQSDAEFPWVPVAVFVGRSLATGAAGAAAKHAYDKFRGRRDDVEADLKILKPKYLPCLKCFNLKFPNITVTKQCFESCRNTTKKATKNDVESEFPWVPVAVFAGRALASGALSAAGAHAYNKIVRRRDADIEADAEIWGTIGKFVAQQGIKQAGKWAYNKIARRDDVEADAEFFKKLGGLVKKVAPIAKKGFDMYKKAKGLGILADAEAEKAEKSEFLKKLLEKVKAKVQERKQKRAEKKDKKEKTVKTDKKALLKKLIQKLKAKVQERKQKKTEKPVKKEKKVKTEKKEKRQKKEKKVETEADAEFFKKLGGLVKKAAPIVKKGVDIYGKAKGLGILSDSEKAEFFKKLVQKIKDKIRNQKAKKAEKPESDKINWGKIFSPKNIQKAVEIYKIIRSDDVVESDAEAEFFKKLGGLVKKVAPIAKKGFDMYKKAKGLGILADAENVDKCAACKLACSFIKDESKKQLCISGLWRSMSG